MNRTLALVVLMACSQPPSKPAPLARRLTEDPPNACADCAAWNRPVTGFQVFGNTYYVGVEGLSSVLVTSKDGHILLDGALPQSASLIDRNIRALGFRTEDVKLILVSHTHYDHVGGVAALQRASGATVVASTAGAAALERGMPTPDDPQRALENVAFPAVPNVRVVRDGEVVRAGTLAVTAHYTPGHTPGATTWSWRSCEGTRCVDVVYADSLNAVSAPSFRFTADAAVVDGFRRSIDVVERLPCDVILTVHPSFARVHEKHAARTGDTNPFVVPGECASYAATARKRLEARVAEETK